MSQHERDADCGREILSAIPQKAAAAHDEVLHVPPGTEGFPDLESPVVIEWGHRNSTVYGGDVSLARETRFDGDQQRPRARRFQVSGISP